MSNPNFIRPAYKTTYDDIIKKSFIEFGERSNDKLKTTIYPFDIFLRNITRNLLNERNPGKTDDEMINDLNEMANFMRQLNQNGVS